MGEGLIFTCQVACRTAFLNAVSKRRFYGGENETELRGEAFSSSSSSSSFSSSSSSSSSSHSSVHILHYSGHGVNSLPTFEDEFGATIFLDFKRIDEWRRVQENTATTNNTDNKVSVNSDSSNISINSGQRTKKPLDLLFFSYCKSGGLLFQSESNFYTPSTSIILISPTVNILDSDCRIFSHHLYSALLKGLSLSKAFFIARAEVGVKGSGEDDKLKPSPTPQSNAETF